MNGHDDYFELQVDLQEETMDSMDIEGNKTQVPFEDVNDVDWNFGDQEEQEDEE